MCFDAIRFVQDYALGRLPEVGRRFAGPALESGREIRGVGITEAVADLCERHIGIARQLANVLDPTFAEEPLVRGSGSRERKPQLLHVRRRKGPLTSQDLDYVYVGEVVKRLR
jgi:hypothetical protein